MSSSSAMSYLLTPHYFTTGHYPTELFTGRCPRSVLDLLNHIPQNKRKVDCKKKKINIMLQPSLGNCKLEKKNE